MQQGEFIVDRLLPDIARSICEQRGISYESLSDEWVLRLTQGDTTRWVLGYKFDINTAAVSGLAQDKVATYEVLTRSGVPAVPHILARSVPHQKVSVASLEQAFGEQSVVLKPLDGTGGRGVQKCDSVADAVQHIVTSTEPAWALAPYLEIVREFRVILLDGDVLVSYEKVEPTELHGLKLFNLGMGARAADISDPTLLDSVQSLAKSASQALSLRLAAIDVIVSEDGTMRVLEVNDGIMMENYARQSDRYRSNAEVAYDKIIGAMFS